MTSRRSFLIGIGAALAAPAVGRAESLMKIAVLRETAVAVDPARAPDRTEFWFYNQGDHAVFIGDGSETMIIPARSFLISPRPVKSALPPSVLAHQIEQRGWIRPFERKVT